MVGGITAVFVNLILNYVLIFGNFGAPALGVKGAAIATAISRYVELGIVAGWAHRHTEACPFMRGAYSSLYIPVDLLKKLPEDKREAAIGVLSDDPRPSYKKDSDRVYGLSFGGYDIRFTVKQKTLTVLEVEKNAP
jgi:hypothetical protein